MYFWFFDCLLGKVLSYFSKEKEKGIVFSAYVNQEHSIQA
jgi:hypothetical protein